MTRSPHARISAEPKSLLVGVAELDDADDDGDDLDGGDDASTAARVARRFRSAVAEQCGENQRLFVDAAVLDSIACLGRLLVHRLRHHPTMTTDEVVLLVEHMGRVAGEAERVVPF